MKKKHIDNVYADCMVPVATLEDIEELIADLVLLLKKDKETGYEIGLRTFAVLRRLQIAENQHKASAAALDFYTSLDRVGIYEGDAQS